MAYASSGCRSFDQFSSVSFLRRRNKQPSITPRWVAKNNHRTGDLAKEPNAPSYASPSEHHDWTPVALCRLIDFRRHKAKAVGANEVRSTTRATEAATARRQIVVTQSIDSLPCRYSSSPTPNLPSVRASKAFTGAPEPQRARSLFRTESASGMSRAHRGYARNVNACPPHQAKWPKVTTKQDVYRDEEDETALLLVARPAPAALTLPTPRASL